MVEELRMIGKAITVGDLKIYLNKLTTVSESIPTLVPTPIPRPRLRLAPRPAVRFLSPPTQRPRRRFRCTSEPLQVDMDEFEKMKVAKTWLIPGNNW